MGFSFPPQVIKINVHITDMFFFNPYGIHIGFSQVITKNVAQKILFVNQFLVFGWYVLCSYSLYSKLLFTNESLSLFQLYTDGKCNEEKRTFSPRKNQSTKESKGISILLTVGSSLFPHSIYSYSFSLLHRSGFWLIIKGNILEFSPQNHVRWWLDWYSKVWNMDTLWRLFDL